MPHSISPESTPANDQSQTISQVSQIETVGVESQDVEMSGTPDADQEMKDIDLEALLFADDDDDEFGSSAPQIKEESSQIPSQPAPMYVRHPPTHTHTSFY